MRGHGTGRVPARSAAGVLGGVLAACAALPAGCGGADEPAPQVLRLSVETAPGVIEFDIRIHTGAERCFGPGSKDIGCTRTIGTGRTRAVLDLEPGTYTYLCAAGGHWRTQHGTLVVR